MVKLIIPQAVSDLDCMHMQVRVTCRYVESVFDIDLEHIDDLYSNEKMFGLQCAWEVLV